MPKPRKARMEFERKDPETDDEWQDAVDLAHVLLHVDAARKYGLITGGPEINTWRCEEIIDLGAERDITPREDAVGRIVPMIQAGALVSGGSDAD